MAVAIFPGVVVSLGVPEWGQGTAAAIGMDAIGMAAIGMAVTGAVAIGTAIGTVIAVTIMLSSSAASAFPAGGAGVGRVSLRGLPLLRILIWLSVRLLRLRVWLWISRLWLRRLWVWQRLWIWLRKCSQYSSPTRSKVAELQRRLSRAGYYRGSVDGILGPQTRRAIRAYESDHGYADAG